MNCSVLVGNTPRHVGEPFADVLNHPRKEPTGSVPRGFVADRHPSQLNPTLPVQHPGDWGGPHGDREHPVVKLGNVGHIGRLLQNRC